MNNSNKESRRSFLTRLGVTVIAAPLLINANSQISEAVEFEQEWFRILRKFENASPETQQRLFKKFNYLRFQADKEFPSSDEETKIVNKLFDQMRRSLEARKKVVIAEVK